MEIANNKQVHNTQDHALASDIEASTSESPVLVARIFSAANLVSLSRAFLIIPIIIYLQLQNTLYALILMGIGAISDFLDGYIARHSRTVSAFGKVLDPIADKIVIGNVLIYLCAFRELPWWFLVLLILRDVTIAVSAAYLMNAHRKAFQANFSGKLSVNFLALTLILYVINWEPVKYYVMWTAAAVMTLSWIRYLRVYFIYLKIHQERKTRRSHYA